MYPLSGSSPVDIEKTVTLPDGRGVSVCIAGTNEHDTNAFVLDDMFCIWTATGEPVQEDEYNVEVTHDGHDYYLHELILHLALD